METSNTIPSIPPASRRRHGFTRHLLGAATLAVTTAVIGTPAAHAGLMSSDLKALWTFDNNYTDAVGNHNGSTVGGGTAPTIVAGKFGSAVESVSGTYLSMANATDFQLSPGSGKSMTLTGWFKSFSSSSNAGNGVVGNETSFGGPGWLIGTSSGNGNVYFRNAGSARSMGAGYGNPAWYQHWWFGAVVFASNGSITGYLENNDHTTFGTALNVSNLGTYTSGMDSNQFDVLAGASSMGVDDLAVWNRALTSTEINSIFNGGAGADVATLTATPVPEPVSAGMIFGLGTLGMGVLKRRRGTRLANA